jgi:diguanylate cyclase (GGDEF)-like protein
MGSLLLVCRSSDLTVRVGGDEFVIFFPVRASEDFLMTIATRLIEEVGALGAKIFGERISLGLSIGISRWPEGVTSAANLLRLADAAMYVAKRTGKNRYHLGKRPEYLAEMHATGVNRTDGANSLLSQQ